MVWRREKGWEVCSGGLVKKNELGLHEPDCKGLAELHWKWRVVQEEIEMRETELYGEREREKERRQMVQKEIPHPQAAGTDRQVSLSQTPLHTIISSNYSWCIASIKVNSPGLTADWIQNWMPPWVWTQEPFYIKIIMEIIILADDITHCNDLTIMIIGQWLSLDHHWPNITYSALTHS